MAPRLLAIVAVFLLAACASEVRSPAAEAGSKPPPSSTPTRELSASPATDPSPLADVPRSIDPIGDVQCDGGATSGSTDYAADAGAGLTDIEEATRALRGVLPSDDVVVDAERTAVRRDGRVTFIGWWVESPTGGWRLSSFVACGDSGIGFD